MNKHSLENWATVATFNDASEAKKLRSFLAKEGFEAKVYDDRKLQRRWFLAKRPHATFQTQVRESNHNAALDILQRQSGAAEGAIHCPNCDSLRVQYPQMTRKFLLPTLLAHLFVAAGIMEHEYYCEACHHQWKRNPARANSPAPRSAVAKPAH